MQRAERRADGLPCEGSVCRTPVGDGGGEGPGRKSGRSHVPTWRASSMARAFVVRMIGGCVCSEEECVSAQSPSTGEAENARSGNCEESESDSRPVLSARGPRAGRGAWGGCRGGGGARGRGARRPRRRSAAPASSRSSARWTRRARRLWKRKCRRPSCQELLRRSGALVAYAALAKLSVRFGQGRHRHGHMDDVAVDPLREGGSRWSRSVGWPRRGPRDANTAAASKRHRNCCCCSFNVSTLRPINLALHSCPLPQLTQHQSSKHSAPPSTAHNKTKARARATDEGRTGPGRRDRAHRDKQSAREPGARPTGQKELPDLPSLASCFRILRSDEAS